MLTERTDSNDPQTQDDGEDDSADSEQAIGLLLKRLNDKDQETKKRFRQAGIEGMKQRRTSLLFKTATCG